jgi:hypothetical protein
MNTQREPGDASGNPRFQRSPASHLPCNPHHSYRLSRDEIAHLIVTPHTKQLVGNFKRADEPGLPLRHSGTRLGDCRGVTCRLAAYEQAGAQEIILYMPDAATLESVRLFARACKGTSRAAWVNAGGSSGPECQRRRSFASPDFLSADTPYYGAASSSSRPTPRAVRLYSTKPRRL